VVCIVVCLAVLVRESVNLTSKFAPEVRWDDQRWPSAVGRVLRRCGVKSTVCQHVHSMLVCVMRAHARIV
jgi:hypothetical protein